jgi:hypothetical protein
VAEVLVEKKVVVVVLVLGLQWVGVSVVGRELAEVEG